MAKNVHLGVLQVTSVIFPSLPSRGLGAETIGRGKQSKRAVDFLEETIAIPLNMKGACMLHRRETPREKSRPGNIQGVEIFGNMW